MNMFLTYDNWFVKKYSHGNSFADEDDVKNQKYEIKLNKWSIPVYILAFVSIIVCLIVVFSIKRDKIKFRVKPYVERKRTVPIFHTDQFFDCAKDANNMCVNYDAIERGYTNKLKNKLKEKGSEVYDVDDFFCKEPLKKYCESGIEMIPNLTKKELKMIVELLIEEKIKLDEGFEVDTIIKFKDYLRRYEKEYESEKEYKVRYKNFRKNRIYIETHNSDPNQLYKMGYNNVADSSDEEIGRATALGGIKYIPERDEILSGAFPGKGKYPGAIVDWREKGKDLPIRNQGKCGSCWAFSTLDLVSSMLAIKGEELKAYSAQQLMDCVDPLFSCNFGGSPLVAALYLEKFPICTEDEYPYRMADYACIQPNICKKRVKIKEIKDLQNHVLEDYLEKEGPFHLSIYVSKELSFYVDGIFDGFCNKIPNHGVVVVGHGYDKDQDVHYWIARNSWGDDWGEKGYFRIINASFKSKNLETYYCRMDRHAFGIKLEV